MNLYEIINKSSLSTLCHIPKPILVDDHLAGPSIEFIDKSHVVPFAHFDPIKLVEPITDIEAANTESSITLARELKANLEFGTAPN